MIPYGKQSICQADIDAVTNVLRSDFITQGPVVEHFEKAVADKVNAAHAVAVNSGTSALHVACLALGVQTGDEVWTSPITFVASANCARYCGANIDFVDIDPATYLICPHKLRIKLEQAKREGRLPKLLIVVHLCGLSCDMKPIASLAQEFGFAVIEDASHAIGGRYEQQPIGCCRYSDVAVFSFHPVKIITTAEGGMATTQNEALAKRMRQLRSHGVVREAEALSQAADGPWYYEQQTLGFNYRMSDLHAALGLSQLNQLDAFVQARHAIAARYNDMLADLPLQAQHQPSHCYSAYHLYVITLNDSQQHAHVFEMLRQQNIGVQLHYIPVYRQPYYRAFGYEPQQFEAAENYYQSAISLPIYPSLQDDEQDAVVQALAKALAQ